jgi:hypothetical protein
MRPSQLHGGVLLRYGWLLRFQRANPGHRCRLSVERAEVNFPTVPRTPGTPLGALTCACRNKAGAAESPTRAPLLLM